MQNIISYFSEIWPWCFHEIRPIIKDVRETLSPEFWAAGGVCWLHCQRTESDRAAGRRSCRQKEEDQRSDCCRAPIYWTSIPTQTHAKLNTSKVLLEQPYSFHLPTHNLPHHTGKKSKLKVKKFGEDKRSTPLDHGAWGQRRRSVLKHSLYLMRPIKYGPAQLCKLG